MKLSVTTLIIFIAFLFGISRCWDINTRRIKEVESGKSIYYPPTKSPFGYNAGINFSVEQTGWFTDSLKYNQQGQYDATYGRLKGISKDFKLIRIYSYLIAGWEQTGTLSAEGYAVSKLAQQDKTTEFMIGTSNNIAWYSVQSNVQAFVDTLQSKFGTSITQVKTILVGNEINANGYTSTQVSTIIGNFKIALANNKLNIPVTVSFSNLPIQSGDNYSDGLVASVISSWDSTWNSNKPFVFIDPYPDANGIGTASGVYKWQYGVTKYYKTLHPSLQIFIGETGAEGSINNHATAVVVNDIFNQLNLQYSSLKKTVPTFLFEGINEKLKPPSPNQQYMGLYFDSQRPSETDVYLKVTIVLPKWLGKK
jgi:hypothetical protein